MSLKFISIILLLNSVQLFAQEEDGGNSISGNSLVDISITEAEIIEIRELATTEVRELIRSYEENIKILRLELAPYDPELAEQIQSLGVIYQKEGNHPLAIAHFKESLFINRTNFGLYNMGDLELLDKLYISYSKLQDWENVNNLYEYIYWLHNRNLDIYDFEWLPILRSYFHWQWQAFYVKTGETRGYHEWKRRNLYNRISEIIENITGSNELTDCFIFERKSDGPCTSQIIQLIGNN